MNEYWELQKAKSCGTAVAWEQARHGRFRVNSVLVLIAENQGRPEPG